MTSKDLSKYILVVFRQGRDHMVLATSDCLEELEHHRKIHGLQGFTQIVKSQNFSTPRQNGKQANISTIRSMVQALSEEVTNERIDDL